jgi:hypothetical protein
MARPGSREHDFHVWIGLQCCRESICLHEQRALGAQLNLAIKAEVNGVGMEHAVEVEE